jgi:hypothetical protein
MREKVGFSVWDLTDELPTEDADPYILLSPAISERSPGTDRF